MEREKLMKEKIKNIIRVLIKNYKWCILLICAAIFVAILEDVYEQEKMIIDTVIYKLSYNPNNALKSKKKGAWGQSIHLGVYAGYGLDIQTQPKFSPSVGVCISYGFGYSWQIINKKAISYHYDTASIKWHKNIKNRNQKTKKTNQLQSVYIIYLQKSYQSDSNNI